MIALNPNITTKWNYISAMTCPTWTSQRAMQVEWLHKYPTRRKPRPKEFNGPIGRLNSFMSILDHLSADEQYFLYIADDYYEMVTDMVTGYLGARSDDVGAGSIDITVLPMSEVWTDMDVFVPDV